MHELHDIIYRHAAQNRLRYGKADEKSVVGKILSEIPEARKRAAEVSLKVKAIVAEVNSARLEDLEQFREEKKVREERIAEISLPGMVPDPLVVRFAPNPNGPPTLGSARGIVVNSMLAKKYGGKFVIRFDDTDPKTKTPLIFAYGQYLEDCEWLGAKPDEVHIASDRVDSYYEYAEKLISLGGAYVCFCKKDEFKSYKDKALPCPHRAAAPEENKRLWQEMLDGKYAEGEAVLRVKTDIEHKDPAMRDWAAFRIIDADHPRTGRKYLVWPMLDFESAIEDHVLGITLIIRGIDLMDSEGRQKYVYDFFGWEYPKTLHWGRVQLEEFGKFSTSMIRKGIDEGTYSGWDDPRLPTLMALRRRGIAPETIKKTMVGLGLGENHVSLSMETVYAENRKILDPKVNRYFFVADPIKAEIDGAPEKDVKIPLHPSFKDRGARETHLPSGKVELRISGEDAKSLEVGETVRLMNLYNAKVVEKTEKKIRFEYLEEKRLDVKKIQWVKDGAEADLVTPEGRIKGVCEEACKDVEAGDVVQFERVGFARLDAKDGSMTFYFSHR